MIIEYWYLHDFSVLQGSVSSFDPEHGIPAQTGAGLLHVLLRFLWPPEHVELQLIHDCQADQDPLTAETKCGDNYYQHSISILLTICLAFYFTDSKRVFFLSYYC